MRARVAAISGSSRGIGRAIALELAREGYQVVINYHKSKAGAEEVLEQIEAEGGTGIIVGADVSSSAGAQHFIETAVNSFGKIEVLVNNAGVNKDQLMLKISDEEWRQIIDSNLGSAFYCSRWALKNMLRRRYGRIINISSVVGLGGNAGQAHYAAAKSGLMGLTCSIAKEYGRRGVTANLVAPGYIQTDMTAALNDSQKSRIAEGIALGRLGTPADVAGVVAFLASPRADYINGTVIRVDGGLSSI